MTLSSNAVQSTSGALVLYNPDLPHISLKSQLETVTDKVFKRSLEIAKFETSHLSPSELPLFARSPSRLAILAHHLPEILTGQQEPLLPFSGVAAFQVGDAPSVQACYCPSQEVEFTTDQSFNVLSVGKLFTAVAVMQLIEEGRLSLETPLSKLLSPKELDLLLLPPYEGQNPTPEILKSLKKQMDKITLKHILSHTAGLIGDDGKPGKIGTYKYSNYGYRLLAQIIGKHSGLGKSLEYEAAFRKYIETRIFRPAHMEGAVAEISLPKKKMDKEPHCFEVSEDGIRERVKTEEPYPHGNGCWRMPMRDLLKFGDAIRHHVLIKKRSLLTMLNPKLPLGFMLDCDQQTGLVTGFGHPGHAPGRSAFFWCYVAGLPITAAVLSNYNTGDVKPLLDPVFSRSKL